MTPAVRNILLGLPGWLKAAYGPFGAIPDVALHFDDGRYFGGSLDSLLSCSRASTGYAEDAAGNLISFPTNTLRRTNKGLLIEEAKTNVVLWNRDLTNAAWTASNVTVAEDQAGADGTANAASSLTATNANGTVLQAITLASSARFQSAYVKRITGTGVIEMTMDNGTTWTAIVPTSVYQQLSIPTQTLANPTVGFRIVTSGDAIAVDFVQNENGAVKTSPIPTTTVSVTRAIDAITFAGLANTLLQGAAQSAFGSTNIVSNASSVGLISANSTSNQHLRVATATTAAFRAAGVSTSATIGGSGNWTTGPVKAASSYDASGHGVVANNGTVATAANAFTPSGTNYLGSSIGTGAAVIDGYVSRIALWPTRLPDATLKALTQ